jgi:hypothetical protein
MLSLNQLVQLFEDKKNNHAQLSSGTFYFGDPWEFGNNSTITYPFMGVVLNNSNLNGVTLTTSFQIFFCDLVNKDESNEDNVLSNLQQVALDIYSQIKYDLENYYDSQINGSATLNDFTERFDDEVSGWEVTLNVEQFYDHSTCNLPDSNVGSGKVLIIDQDGNTIATLNPNSTYTVTQLTTILQDLSNTPPTTIIQDLT